jgi:tRNA threonylcarbamoyladenosine biosynthesis protein TsaB
LRKVLSMKCLAVNTATKILSLALVEGEKALHFYETTETRNQGNLLLGHIQQALKKNNLDFADLDVLAVVTGPGSFTGIRVGLATMRGIALAAGKPLIGFSSFDMFAVHGMDAVNIVAVESLRDELYFAVMDEDGPLIACSNETPEAFVQRFRHELPGDHPLCLSGDAAAVMTKFFPQTALADKEGNALNIAHLALHKFKEAGAGATFPNPTPYYLREADVTISSKIARTVKE